MVRERVTYLPSGKIDKQGTHHVAVGCAAITSAPMTGTRDLHGAPFAELFRGKGAAEVRELDLKATTLAVLASSREIDHLHAHFGIDATTVALLASRLSGIPFSFTAHARDIYHTFVSPEADAAMRRRKIAESAFVATVSEYNRRHLIGLVGPGSAVKIHRLYNGIDLTRFKPRSAEPEANLILGIGRLVEKKGFGDLVEACRLLKAGGLSFRCLIVGDGPLGGALERQITGADLVEVSLLGALPQEALLDVMAQASAVVLPCVVSASGDRDGLPTVLLEALAMGLPAISTTVAGVPEIIDHERTGLLVPPNSPQALAGAMDKLRSDPELRRRMGSAARAKAERAFDLRSNVAILKGHFTGTANHRTSPLRGVG